MTNQRVIWIDNLKGFLIIMVVAGHVLQTAIDSNIDSIYMEQIFEWIYSFHMPLFFGISGYVYSLTLRKNLQSDDFWSKWKKRIYSLLYIYMVYSILMWNFKYFFFNSLAKESVNIATLFLLPLQPISVYWYIHTLIGMFLIVPIFEKKIKPLNYRCLLMMVIIQCISIHFEWPYALNKIVYMFPFFASGVLIDNFIHDYIHVERLVMIFFIFLLYGAEVLSFRELSIIKAYLWGMFFVLLFKEYFSKKIGLITYLGENCLSVYLFHPYVVASLKVLFIKFGLLNWEYVITSLICSIVTCLIIIIMTRHRILRKYIYSPF